jgi:peptidoglycan/xylan/chitin deacetylase (PgdA/CDA1 family)
MTYESGGHSGSKSLYINMSARTSGDAKWMADPVTISPNSQYTYTDYYQSSVATELDAQYTDNTGAVSYAYLASVPASSTWSQSSATFTTPANAAKVVILHIIYSNGWLQTDDFSLSGFSAPSLPVVNVTSPASGATVSGTTSLSANASDSAGIAGVQFQIDGSNVGPEDTSAPYQFSWDSTTVPNGAHNVTAVARNTANAAATSNVVPITVSNAGIPPSQTTNLIGNPSMETTDPSNPAQPQGWLTAKTGTNTTAFNYLNTGHTGNRSLQVNMTKRTSGNAKWYFTPINISPNTTYTFKDWYQSNVATSLQIALTRTNGTTSNIATASLAKSGAWKQASLTFTTPSDAKSLTVYHLLNKVGQLTIDDFDIEGPAQQQAPPTVNLTAPANNATISGTQTISANATDSNGITSVQFKLDGNNLGTADTTDPYSVSWDTTSAANGTHNLTAVATGTSGLSTESAAMTVNVQNSTTPPDNTNLISNPSFETNDGTNPTGWSQDKWGTNTTQFTYSGTGHTGSHSATINITQYTSGDAKWDASPVNVTAGKTYVYTDFYKSNIASRSVAAFIDSSGNYTYSELPGATAASSWTKYSAEFTAPANAVKVVIFHLIDSVGSLTIDDVSLSEYTPPTPGPGAYIANPSVETADPVNSQMPAGWTHSSWGNNTANFQYINNDGHTGSKSLKVTVSNYTDGDAKWYFNPITNLVPGSQYRFTTWYKTNTIPHAVAMYLDAQGTEHFFGMPNPQPGTNSATTWQMYSDTFDVPTYAVAATAFFFMPNNGWVQVDDQSLATYTPVGWNRPLVTLTFDDGYEENVQTVLPVLDKYGFKSTQCYETQDIEGVPGASDMVMDFYNDGHEICAHTVTHPFLTTLTTSQVDYELSHSQQVLQNIIGAPVKDFASPYGDYNQAVNVEIAKYFQSHRTVDEGYNSKDNFDKYRLRVQNMTPDTTIQEFQYWLDKAKATNTWLILVYHRVTNDTPEAFDSTVPEFNQQMQALSNSGLTVRTWADALAEVQSQL